MIQKSAEALISFLDEGVCQQFVKQMHADKQSEQEIKLIKYLPSLKEYQSKQNKSNDVFQYFTDSDPYDSDLPTMLLINNVLKTVLISSAHNNVQSRDDERHEKI